MPSQKINTKHENNNKNNKRYDNNWSVYTLLIYNYNYKYKRRDRFKLVAHTENKKRRRDHQENRHWHISYLIFFPHPYIDSTFVVVVVKIKTLKSKRRV